MGCEYDHSRYINAKCMWGHPWPPTFIPLRARYAPPQKKFGYTCVPSDNQLKLLTDHLVLVLPSLKHI